MYIESCTCPPGPNHQTAKIWWFWWYIIYMYPYLSEVSLWNPLWMTHFRVHDKWLILWHNATKGTNNWILWWPECLSDSFVQFCGVFHWIFGGSKHITEGENRWDLKSFSADTGIKISELTWHCVATWSHGAVGHWRGMLIQDVKLHASPKKANQVFHWRQQI